MRVCRVNQETIVRISRTTQEDIGRYSVDPRDLESINEVPEVEHEPDEQDQEDEPHEADVVVLENKTTPFVQASPSTHSRAHRRAKELESLQPRGGKGKGGKGGPPVRGKGTTELTAGMQSKYEHKVKVRVILSSERVVSAPGIGENAILGQIECIVGCKLWSLEQLDTE